MVAEAQLVCQPTVGHQYLCPPQIGSEFVDVSPPPAETPFSGDLNRLESILNCSTSKQTTAIFDTARKFTPRIRSGSYTDIGLRSSNEDQHIRIDDLCSHLGALYSLCDHKPSSFYAVFDGHCGPDAAVYMKNNAMRFFFKDSELPQTSDIDIKFMQDLQSSQRRSFLSADQAMADENSFVDSYCGTTALTALILGRNLLIANIGDCRAVLCRRGDAVQLSQDHRPSCQVERKRVEDLGGTIEYGYLNGELGVTRALGDWYMKLPVGSASPLTAEPEFQWSLLSEDDEFLIIGCDGIWDVLSNQDAVNLVRRELRHHNDPQRCAKELVRLALRKETWDNVTVIIVCFSSQDCQKQRSRHCVSEEALNKLINSLEGI